VDGTQVFGKQVCFKQSNPLAQFPQLRTPPHPSLEFPQEAKMLADAAWQVRGVHWVLDGLHCLLTQMYPCLQIPQFKVPPHPSSSVPHSAATFKAIGLQMSRFWQTG